MIHLHICPGCDRKWFCLGKPCSVEQKRECPTCSFIARMDSAARAAAMVVTDPELGG